MNKDLINKRFSKVLYTYHHEANVQRCIVDRLFSFIPNNITVNSLLEIGCGSGFLTQLLTQRFNPKTAIINDLSQVWTSFVKDNFLPDSWEIYTEDAEQIKLSSSFDFIASASTIQWFENPSEFIKKMFDHLNPDGLLLISTFGKNNFTEIATITNKKIPYPSFEELLKLLPQNIDIQTFEEQIVEKFSSPMEVLKHLKKTGVNAIEKSVWTKKTICDFTYHYENQFSTETGVTLTYHPMYLIIKK